MLKKLMRIVALLFILSSSAYAQESVFVGNVPLPNDAIEAEEVHSKFAGTWVGQRDGWRNHILIIEQVNDDGFADVIYAVGSDLNGAGRWFRRQAKIEGDDLIFADDGFSAHYRMSATGRVRGVFDADKGFAVLERQNLKDVLALPDEDWFSIGQQEYLQTDLIEEGKPIRLNVVTYTPPGEGPFPVALIHHGSTGSGTRPSDFDLIWTSDWLADMLNEHGWFVVFPYRRGRGLSDGQYDEGFALDRSKGYSPEAALSLPGAERALTDANAALAALRKRLDLDQGAILVGGITKTSLGSDAENIANHQHPYDQLRVNRRTAQMAIVWRKLLTDTADIQKPVNLAQNKVRRDMCLQIEVVKQPRWSFLNTHHSQIPSHLTKGSESNDLAQSNSDFFNKISPK